LRNWRRRRILSPEGIRGDKKLSERAAE